MEICKKEDCVGCLNCFNICKYEAIKIVEDELGFIYPEINVGKCKKCNACKNVCPVVKVQEVEGLKISYACKNKNDNIRKNSSSGGMFYELANEIISKDGTVYGAGYNEKFDVIHKRITQKEELKELMGSKYVQSDLKIVFINIKEDLEACKRVLFSGTPCQVNALKTFLKKEHDNLYLVDFVCHGVGSKVVLEKHVKEILKEQEEDKIKNISFRNKDNGWRNFNFKIETARKTYTASLKKDEFMKAFLRNLCLRESCYNCKFKGNNRTSDITMADFWGIEKVNKEFSDDKGISAIIINTKKGEQIFNKIEKNFDKISVTYEDIRNNNICLEKSSRINKYKKRYTEDVLNGVDLKEIDEKYYLGE